MEEVNDSKNVKKNAEIEIRRRVNGENYSKQQLINLLSDLHKQKAIIFSSKNLTDKFPTYFVENIPEEELKELLVSALLTYIGMGEKKNIVVSHHKSNIAQYGALS